MGYGKDSFLEQPFAPLKSHILFKSLIHPLPLKRQCSFTTPRLAERKQHGSHLYQEMVYSVEQVELMGLVRRCFVMAQEVKRVTEMGWSWGLHQ